MYYIWESSRLKESILFQKSSLPFTVRINCSSDLKMFANSWPSASNFKSFSPLLQQIVSHSSSKQFWKQNTRATLSYFWSVHVKKKLGSHPSSYNSLQCCILFEVAFKFLSPSFYSNFGNCNFIEILAPLCNVHPLSWHLYMMRNLSAFFSEVSVTTKFCHCQNKHQFLLAFSVWISPWFFLFSFWNYIANTHRSSRSEQIFIKTTYEWILF